ncbi:MAG: ABC transporter ATP-binding protein, partial [Anaerolineae bacterium]|nr:ABC transporter ATP-binding protein [Anaerolineae bacterium]
MEQSSASNSEAVLEVVDLGVVYDTDKGPLKTVRHVSLSIRKGEIYGLVGESGSGKTTFARAIVGYLPRNGRVTSGNVVLNGTNLLDLSPGELRRIWGAKIAMVHQDPAAAVNPAIPVGQQVAEVARTHLGMNRAQAYKKALEMLTQVGMPDSESVARRYAHQLSGGMLQRILIASALATNPQLLIMDEPTTALDVTTEAVILDLVQELLQQYQTAVLYITHNLGVVARICDRVGVLYAGEMMEEGTVQELFKDYLHPYTLGLMGCVPRIDASKRDIELNTVPGYIPRPDELPGGCIFAPRCPMAEDACESARPPLREVGPGHLTACRRWQEVGDRPNLFVTQEPASSRLQTEEGRLILEATEIKKHFRADSRGVASLWQRRP